MGRRWLNINLIVYFYVLIESWYSPCHPIQGWLYKLSSSHPSQMWPSSARPLFSLKYFSLTNYRPLLITSFPSFLPTFSLTCFSLSSFFHSFLSPSFLRDVLRDSTKATSFEAMTGCTAFIRRPPSWGFRVFSQPWGKHQESWPRWSRGNVLASRSKIRGFKLDWERWIFSGRKNREHKSSGRNFKLRVPSLRFQAR